MSFNPLVLSGKSDIFFNCQILLVQNYLNIMPVHRSLVYVALYFLLAGLTNSLPKICNNSACKDASFSAKGKTQNATDGLTILDKTVTIEYGSIFEILFLRLIKISGLPIRYKISAQVRTFKEQSGVLGANADTNTEGIYGLNVLLHGDGGQSFQDFPNQAVQDNLIGVAVLAPNKRRIWGGGSGLDRTDGVAHAAAVNTLIQKYLPQDLLFNSSRVFFTGVSGGSLLLSGFFIPAYGVEYKTGVVLNCGGLTPQVPIVKGAEMVSNMKIHFQSTQNELADLRPELPRAISAYESLASRAGLSNAQIGRLQTVDNTPNGGHCAFDGKDFVSGVQLISSNYANIMGDQASGKIEGIGNVLKVNL